MNLLVNLDVDDLEKAIAFYSMSMGLRVGRRFGLSVVEMLGSSAPRRATCGGGRRALETPIATQPWGKLALMADPFGHGFYFVQFFGVVTTKSATADARYRFPRYAAGRLLAGSPYPISGSPCRVKQATSPPCRAISSNTAGMEQIRLEARADNLAALAFTHELGFTRSGRLAGYCERTVDAVQLEKGLL